MSNPTDADWKRMLSLVDDFYKKQECDPFREPVPWKSLGLVDYPAIIKNPMDLGTIKRKIKTKSYPTLYKCAEDVRLVWSNCLTYNADGSDFFKLAEKLHKQWETQFNKLLTEIGATSSNTNSSNATGVGSTGNSTGGTGGDSSNKVSLQDKRNLAKLLYLITKEDLGKVLVDLEQKCPAALKRNATEDELELNIDAIPAKVMQDVTAFVQSLKNANKKKPPPTKSKKQKVAPTSGAAGAPA